MPEADLFLLFLLFIKKLNEVGIPYVVVRKLQFFREGGSEKHIGDILAMMRVSADRVRPNVLEKWLSEFRLQSLWNDRIEKRSAH